MNDFDDLDRALFALPLATPPHGLRGAILRATIFAPTPPAAVPFSQLEIVGIGVALALCAWLVLLSSGDHRFALAIVADARAFAQACEDPAALVWTMLGGSVAALLTLANLRPQRRELRKS